MAEIEEEFYKTFDIKPKWKDKRVKYAKTYYTEEQAEYLRRTTKNRNIQLVYPPITDRILLELICILNDFDDGHYESITLEELKQEVLEDLIYYHNAIGNIANQELKDKVLSLFKVGAEDE